MPIGRPPIISPPLYNSYPIAVTRRQVIKNAAVITAAVIIAQQLLAHELAAKPTLKIYLAK